ncbi:class I SAM-dependent methyltransferase [bacterium]|nr:class I SAM-dependent methyltransferase [bacterium]
MPSMKEIYQSCAVEYDELVNNEDYKGNIESFLMKNIDWDGKCVYEAGVATGRLTKIFAHCAGNLYVADQSQHMLKTAKLNLVDLDSDIEYLVSSNENLVFPQDNIDVFIEGWSFGHTFGDNKSSARNLFGRIFDKIAKNLVGDGKIVLLETLGTCVNEPEENIGDLVNFYKLLENDFGFERNILRTDYLFSSVTEAARIMGFFFGETMRERVLGLNSHEIKEFTGIWLK